MWFTLALSLYPLVSLTPTDDNDAHPSNQAKAEKQRDQYEVEGQKVESLFTDDGEFANNMEPPLHDVESMEISRIARVCWIA